MKPLEAVPAVADLLRPPRTMTSRCASRQKAKPQATVVSHRVHKICCDLFPLNHFAPCGPKPQNFSIPLQQSKFPVHKTDPQLVEWVEEDASMGLTYMAVAVDGFVYKACAICTATIY